MRTVLRVGSVLIALLVIGSCATVPESVDAAFSRTGGQEPIILWWSGYADQVENITHVVNDVWIGDRENPGDKDPAKHQDAWLERGIVPLDWAGGRVYADQGVEALVNKWSAPLNQGYIGIAIDEFGSTSDEVDRTLNEALLLLRERHPDALIYVWHAGLIDEQTAAVYEQAADAVLLEVYVGGEAFLGITMGFRLWNARNHGIEHKTVVSISVGEEAYADSVGEVRAQINWIMRNARDFAGIGFFASRGTEELVSAADRAMSPVRSQDRRR
jgi:hypothetical protein